MTDRELIERCRRDPAAPDAREALCELMRRHVHMVYAAALREVRQPALADDITQAVFLVLLRRAKDLRPDTQLAGWLFKVMRYAAADLRKKQARRDRHEREAQLMRPEIAPSSPQAAWPDIEPGLNHALARLSADDRSIVILRYLENRSIPEISQSLGITENATRQRLSRALQRLRKHFVKRGAPIAAAALLAALEQSPASAAPAALVADVSSLIAGGAVPSASLMSLVTGVLTAMRTAKISLFAACAAAALVLGASTWFAVNAFAADDKPVPAAPAAPAPAAVAAANAAPTSQPATAPAPKFVPDKTPRGTVVAAYKAALAGNEDDFINCFDTLTDTQKTTLKQVAQVMNAVDLLGEQVKAKFGAEALAEFNRIAPLGTDPADIEKAKEFLDGDNATVDIGNSGPGKVAVVKVGDVWKISSATLDTLNANVVTQSVQMIPVLKNLTEKVKAGKYASIDDLKADVNKTFRGQ